MHVIPSARTAPPTPTKTGVRALTADLRAPEDPVARDMRRRAVVRRLVEAGVSPALIEAVLPGWGRYRAEPGPVDRPTAGLQA